jgi:putative membrane protein
MSDATSPTDNVRPAVTRILALSGAAFLFLVWLIYFKTQPEETNPEALSFLPAVNAGLNAIATICIICGVLAIKAGKRKVHIGFMITAITMSAIFLVSYIVYHNIHGDTKFVTEGAIRTIYFGVLISHIFCTVFALPLIMSAVFFAVTKRYELHKKVVKFTVPLWLYVSITGVVIFFLLKANS